MRNTVGKKHTSLKPPKNSECIVIAYERLQGSSVPFPDLQGVRTSSKTAPGHSEHSRRYTDTLKGALRSPLTSKGSSSARPEERGTRWTLSGELPRDGQWETMSLQHVLGEPKCLTYPSQLRAAAGCQHPCGICRPNHLPSIAFCNSAASTTGVLESVPTNTASVMARSARQQNFVNTFLAEKWAEPALPVSCVIPITV